MSAQENIQNPCQVKFYSRVHGAKMNRVSAKSLIPENLEKSICYNAASFGISSGEMFEKMEKQMRQTAYVKKRRGHHWYVYSHWADEPFLGIGEPLSYHETEAKADEAITRYKANDKRRAVA